MLGFVSMFMDISSELVHSLLPIFMATVLGASMVTIGIVEGVAEAAAAITKMFSGAISDYFRKRKFLILLGYALGHEQAYLSARDNDWVGVRSTLYRIAR